MVQGLFEDANHDPYPDNDAGDEEPFILTNYKPDNPGETLRRTGLAWSAGIAFVGAIAFMLFLGWMTDILLGSSPWGIVGGIVLGSLIGFLQFFRINSRIFAANKTAPAERPILSNHEDSPFHGKEGK